MSKKFIDILLEAKGKKKKPSTLKIDSSEIEKDSTDYSMDGDQETTVEEDEDEFTEEEPDTEDDSDSFDYTETESETSPEEDSQQLDNENSEEPTPEEGTDELESSDDPPMDTGTDYTSDGDTEPSEPGEEDGSDQPVDSNLDEGESKNTPSEYTLKQNIIKFYELTDGTLEKLNNTLTSDAIMNKIIFTVKKNLERLKSYTFNYIKYDMNNNDYITNLTMYNKLLATMKINVRMLKYLNDDMFKNQDNRKKDSKTAK